MSRHKVVWSRNHSLHVERMKIGHSENGAVLSIRSIKKQNRKPEKVNQMLKSKHLASPLLSLLPCMLKDRHISEWERDCLPFLLLNKGRAGEQMFLSSGSR